MSWFSRFFPKDEPALEKAEIPFSTIIRWALYDLSIDNPNEIAVKLGLNPVSEEGDTKEIDDSYLRLDMIGELVPYLDIISEINARIIASVQERELKEGNQSSGEELKEEELEAMMEFYKALGYSALITAFSSGIQLGIIHPHAIGTEAMYQEIDDE